jgi:hypothetical protein
MTPKKKIVEDFEKGETVPTQELAEAYIEETKAPAPQPKPAVVRLIAYAAFEQDGERYEEGDEFIPRKTWKRNLAAEEFRSVEKKRPNVPAGIVFSVPGPVLNKGKKDEEQTTLTVILPLKEA